MRRTWRASLISLAIFAGAAVHAETAGTARVTVRVADIRTDKGNVRFAIWNKADGFTKPKQALQRGVVDIGADRTAQYTFTGLTPGDYAIVVMHDENRNEKLDRNLLGFPKEPIIFSNGASIRLGPPSFDDAKFAVRPGDQEVQMSFRH
jgi:uncharacterized protein (DUF2141 family)